MSNQAHLVAAVESVDAFPESRAFFEQTLESLEHEPLRSEAELARYLRSQGTELMRRMLQEKVNLAHARETKPAGVKADRVRTLSCDHESEFGSIRIPRAAYLREGLPAQIPLDRQLQLPNDKYSMTVREQVALTVTDVSIDKTIEQIQHTSGAHVPKRQAEQLIERAAQDVDDFYGQRPPIANDTSEKAKLLVMTSDSKGTRMRPEGLRDSTRKAAENEAKQASKADPMAAKKLRKHDKRMAIVTAVCTQDPYPRTAQDILQELTREKPSKEGEILQDSGKKTSPSAELAKRKTPQVIHAKVVKASVVKTQPKAIQDMFLEASRFDSGNTKQALVLVDGEERQQKAIKAEAKRLGWCVILVVDLIHVLHYLWLAGKVLGTAQNQTPAKWVTSYTEKLIRGQTVRSVITAIKKDLRALKKERNGKESLTKNDLESVSKCIGYLRKNAPYLNYGEFIGKGYPIATGVIEGACRYIVKDRMDITGARWGLAGAESVLKLRYVKANGDWDAYWNFHEKREFERVYPK